jgi:hypothetical protein
MFPVGEIVCSVADSEAAYAYPYPEQILFVVSHKNCAEYSSTGIVVDVGDLGMGK